MEPKRIRVTAEFRITFGEITPELYARMNSISDPEEVRRDPGAMADVERQARLMRALLEDEEALRGFLACAVIAEVVSSNGGLLRKALRADNEEEVLRRLTESLGGEDAEFFEGVRADGVFEEWIDLLLYSTPIECLGVWMTE